ncbi:hypothetical protein WDZ92_25180 [Nostoc sp. NIES-2111]
MNIDAVPNHHAAFAWANFSFEQVPSSARAPLLNLRLHDVGITVGEAWEALNTFVREARTGEAPESAGPAKLAQALWNVGVEYVVTEPGVACEHEGWLHFANPDVGAPSYPELDDWDVPMGMAMTKMREGD